MKIIFILLFFYTISIKADWEVFDNSKIDNTNKLEYLNSFLLLDYTNNIWILANNSDVLVKYNKNSTEFFDTNNTKLPFMKISCAAQGPNGDMYFGTYEDPTFEPKEKQTCLIRFDGENWEYFNQHNSPMYPYTIWDILVTGEEEFWVATMIGLYHYKDGDWDSIFVNEDVIKREIHSLASDNEGNVYFTNAMRELYSANTISGTIKYKKDKSFKTNIVSSMNCHIDSLNNLWVNVRNEFHKKINDDTWIVYDSTYFDDENPYLLIITREGKIYTYTLDAVWEYINDSEWVKIIDIPEVIVDGDEEVTVNLGYPLNLKGVDSKGSFWFAPTSYSGLVKYTPEGASVKDKININLYPNPAQNTITIKSEEPIKNLGLYSLNLSKITDYPAKHTTTQEIDISNLASGVYFIKVNDDFVKFVRE